MKYKRGGVALLAAILAVTVVAGIILYILFDPIKKGADTVIKPFIPSWLLDEDDEQEPISGGGEVPVYTTFESTCTDICSPDGCISGVEDDTKSKKCQDTIKFEDNRDYCICGEMSMSEPVIPLDYRNDRRKPTCDDICGKEDMICIGGVDDSSTSNTEDRKCKARFGFEGIDDFCVCREGASTVTPLPVSDPPGNFPSCNDICASKEKVCIVAIDDGKDTRRCDSREIRFEESDDFCVCSEVSEKVIPVPPNSQGIGDQTHSCNFYCGSTPDTSDKCIMGIDDGTKPRRCDKTFRFEDNPERGDDYCFCNGASYDFFPPLDSGNEDKTCNFYCGSTPRTSDKCIIGMDNEGDKSNGERNRCNQPFRFESGDNPRDDYCICGEVSTSEKVVPLDYPDDPNCNDICSPASCGKGVSNTEDKPCSDKFTFDQDDDYCVCGGTPKNIIPLDYRDDNERPSCSDVCGGVNKCGKGVDDGKDDIVCFVPFGFEQRDDYCICGEGFERIIPALG